MVRNSEVSSEPKFTRGEKCLFSHLVITFSLILLVAIIYLVHLYLIEHTLQDAFLTRRSLIYKTDSPKLDSIPIGQLYVNASPIVNACNLLLLTPQWSVGPGHCVAIRSEPDLAYLIYAWRIFYKYGNTDLSVKKSVVHPHFDRDSYVNNIGLLQHTAVRVHRYDLKMLHDKGNFNPNPRNTLILSWNLNGVMNKDNDIDTYQGRIMNKEICRTKMAPIIEVRSYEFCVEVKNKVNEIGHGATVVDQKTMQIQGLFTFGERGGGLPLVVLSLSDFQNWIQMIVN